MSPHLKPDRRNLPATGTQQCSYAVPRVVSHLRSPNLKPHDVWQHFFFSVIYMQVRTYCRCATCLAAGCCTTHSPAARPIVCCMFVPVMYCCSTATATNCSTCVHSVICGECVCCTAAAGLLCCCACLAYNCSLLLAAAVVVCLLCHVVSH